MQMTLQFSNLQDWLQIIDYLGIGLFALTGAIMAARLKQTFVTMAFFALITGVGGGSIRDLLIDAPVFWIHDGIVAGLCLICAIFVWFAPGKFWEGRLLDWLDALGITAYAVFGTAKALQFGVPIIPAALMGIITACAGGIIRDIVAGVPSIIMRRELYVTATAVSAVLYIILISLTQNNLIAATIACIIGFMMRGAAIHWQIGLPLFDQQEN